MASRRGLPLLLLCVLNTSDSAELLVIGRSRSGRSSLARALMGSTAQQVVDYAGCPVVVWTGPESGASAHACTGAQSPVVVGVDGSALSDCAVGAAFTYAAAFDAPVVAVHTSSSGQCARRLRAPMTTDRDTVIRTDTAALTTSLQPFHDLHPNLQ